MSSTQTVPMFSPDGQLGDIPYDQMMAARKAGFKPGVNMKTADGKVGVIPADRVHEATAGGLQIVPFQEQETQHPGFWHAVTSDIAAAFKGGGGFSPYPGMDLEAKQRAAQSSADLNASEKAAGYGPAYRAIAPLAGAVGANVSGMEQAAAEGDVSGVLGHAAVPVAAATAPLAAEGVARAAGAGFEASRPTLKAVGQRTLEAASSVDADKVGWFSPRAAHAVRSIQKAGKVLSDVGTPAEEAAAVNPGAPLPATPAPEQLNPSLVSPARTLPGQVAPERIMPEQPIPGVTSRPFIERVQPDRGLLLTGDSPETSLNRIRELPTPERGMDPEIRPSIERIIDEAIPANEQPVANFQAKAKANYHLSALEEQLNSALGGKKLAPGVPLKNQAAAMQAPAAKLPEGFTPVESSALNGYKYDPAAQTFEAMTKNGEHYVHGEVDPETAQAFVDAESKGLAWNRLRNAPGVTYLGKMRNGKLLAAQPPSALRTSMRVEEPPEGTTVPTEENQMGLLQKMLEEALAKRGR